MGSNSNFSSAKVKEILGAHKNKLMKFSNAAIERLQRKVDNLTIENEDLKKEIVYFKLLMQFHSDTNDEKPLQFDRKV